MTAVQIAFSCEGLRALGLAKDELETFSVPFRQGMTSPFRRKVLSDDQDAILPEGLQWHGNPAGADGNAGPAGRAEHVVHALLLLYATDNATLDALKASVRAALAGGIVRELPITIDTRIESSLFTDKYNVEPNREARREHFGFADGFSQPVPYGQGEEPDEWHAMALGDLLFGYPNAYGDTEDGPRITEERAKCMLPRGGEPAFAASAITELILSSARSSSAFSISGKRWTGKRQGCAS